MPALGPRRGFCREVHGSVASVIRREFGAWNFSLELFYAIPVCAKKKKEQLPTSKHFLVSKNKMLATLQTPVPRPGLSQDKQ